MARPSYHRKPQTIKASHNRATSHPQTAGRGWGARYRSTRVQGFPPQNATCEGMKCMVFVLNTCSDQPIDPNYASACRTHPIRRPGNSDPSPDPTKGVKAWPIILAPHSPFSQLPSQDPQSPATSDHTTRAVSTLLLTSLHAFRGHRSASLLSSRKMCDTESVERCGRSAPRLHHSIIRFWAFEIVPFHLFQLGMTADPIHDRLP